ncbi:MAG: AAA family ATPase [Anaerolineae bacterium]
MDAPRDREEATKVTFLSMQELASLPAPRWLIPNLIPDAGLGFLIGAPAAGKSFFLLELAQSVCRGVPVFGNSALTPTRMGWCLALLPEACASWAARTKAYCDYHGVEYDAEFLCCIQQNDLVDPISWERLFSAIKDLIQERSEPPVLMVVDTLSASIPGHEENSQAEMTLMTSHLQQLVTMGTCIVLAHHTAKYSNWYRGSSVFLGACDWMIAVAASGRTRELRAVKLRDAEGIADTSFEIKPHGDSAVCVGLGVPGPWAQFEAIASAHPGLRQALLHHGLQISGEKRTPPADEDICASGISLKVLQATWNRLDPITPSHAEDAPRYKAAHGARTTALFVLADALCRGGLLEVLDGKLSRKTRDLSVVVRQVSSDEDE